MPAPPPPSARSHGPPPPALPAIIANTPGIETVEVRWWYDRSLPADLRELCGGAAGPDAGLERRVDTYLRHCGDDLAVKMRDGDRLEIKQRCAPAADSALVAGVHGRVEQWRKWSLGCAAGFEPPPAGDADTDSAGDRHAASQSPTPTYDAAAHWVPVAKSRCLLGERCVTVEMTEIRTPDRFHWTLAMEAPADSGLGALRDAASALSLGRFAQWFDIGTSTSYATYVEGPSATRLEQHTSG